MGSARRDTIRLTAVGLCVALCGALVGCNGTTVSPPAGGANSSKAKKARDEAEALAVNGAAGGASAQAKAEPGSAVRRGGGTFNVGLADTPRIAAKGSTPRGPQAPAVAAPAATPKAAPVAEGPATPRSAPRSGWVIRERVVSSIPYGNETDAEEDVVALARDLVERKLGELDPPVRHKPSLSEVRAEFLRKESRQVRPPDATEKEAFAPYVRTDNLVYVEYDVEVTADQVRELRAQDRVTAGVRVVGALFAIALGGFLFLRADEWTKGYLTRWLALAAVAIAGGGAAALLFV
jgi:hypothetical protein